MKSCDFKYSTEKRPVPHSLLFLCTALPPWSSVTETERQAHCNSISLCVEANSNQQQSDNISSRCNQIIALWIKMLSRQTNWKQLKRCAFPPLLISAPYSCFFSTCSCRSFSPLSHVSLPSSSSSTLLSSRPLCLHFIFLQLKAAAAEQGQREDTSARLHSEHIHLDFM